jgi:ferrous iron transport protein B
MKFTIWWPTDSRQPYAVGIPAHLGQHQAGRGRRHRIESPKPRTNIKRQVNEIIAQYESSSPLGDRETLIADSRYGFIERIVLNSVVKAPVQI